MYLGRPDIGRWRHQDRLLAEAYLEHKAQICGGCGHHLADTDGALGAFEGTEKICGACKAIGDHDEVHHKDGRPFWIKLFLRRTN